MYSRINKQSYREIPLSDGYDIVSCCPNYVYSSIEDLIKREDTDYGLEYCRTIGILQSYHGYFYICHMTSTGGVAADIKVRVSLTYLKNPPPSVTPCLVQLFGAIIWRRGMLVIDASLLQVLTCSKALQMKGAMDLIARRHSSC